MHFKPAQNPDMKYHSRILHQKPGTEASGSDRAWYPTGLRRHGAGRGVLAKARPFRPRKMVYWGSMVLAEKGPAKLKQRKPSCKTKNEWRI
jgi:hypothetical protein